MDVSGFVLAGGRSTRMGRDKALLQLEGETLVERGLRQLRGVCAEVAIAGGAPGLTRYGRVIADARPGCGPLSGIVAALEQSATDWNAMLAVDVPFVPASLWRQMIAWAEDCEAIAVLPQVEGKAQPLCGLYSRRAAGVLRAELNEDRLKVMAALESAGPVHLLPCTEVEWFRNLNTPEDVALVR